MPKKQTISLDNFVEWSGEVKGVEIESYMPLPGYVPATEIDINLGRIATLSRLGRLEKVSIGLFSRTDDDTSFSISGASQDGSATAAATKTKTVARSKSSVQQSGIQKSEYPKGSGIVHINANHPDLNDKILRSPKPWAEIIDKGIRDGLKNASKMQLFEPREKRLTNLRFELLMNTFILSAIVVGTQDKNMYPIGAAVIALDNLTDLPSRILRKTFRIPDNDYEITTIKEWPADRFLVVKALASVQKVAKAR